MDGSMTDRERILALLDGNLPDRIPWIPRLQIWYDAHRRRGDLPERYRDCSLSEIERALGMGAPAREGRVHRTRLRNVEVRTEPLGNRTMNTYSTPVGSVSTVSQASATLADGGISAGLMVKHMIERTEDYPVVEYIIEHTDVLPAYDAYLAYEAEIGDRGLPLVAIGPDPMYRIIQDLIGYNQAYFHLHDEKERVLHLYEVLRAHALEVQRVVVDSPARLVLHGEHFDTQFTPPWLFRTYLLPYFQPFADQLHARGKTLVCHADADTSSLLELIKESGFDMAECFVTSPMVPVTLEEARQAFDDQVIIWGGIPSAILCDPVTDSAFEAYMRNLFRTVAPGHAFILGVADNVMAETRFERVERVSEIVREYGTCPIDPQRIPD